MPRFRILNETGRDGIPFDLTNDPMKFTATQKVTIESFVWREPLAGAAKVLVCFAGGRWFDPANDREKERSGFQPVEIPVLSNSAVLGGISQENQACYRDF